MRTILMVVVLALGVAHADAPKGAAAPKAAVDKPKPVKQATRAELETEVERLRTENAKLKAENDELKAKEADREKRLQQQLGGQPATKLK